MERISLQLFGLLLPPSSVVVGVIQKIDSPALCNAAHESAEEEEEDEEEGDRSRGTYPALERLERVPSRVPCACIAGYMAVHRFGIYI
ncbi:hypothetical protein BV898_11586 [Hypsibius exemplaris]|uniref:Secreted protein n=1 Tax=Hypsibius exemplaris TaxID=2072580 RepID=A0A1W0WGC3_HYPEX|nr:hypothetical protein BV898_11586 [Hypsibius exemplaris]